MTMKNDGISPSWISQSLARRWMSAARRGDHGELGVGHFGQQRDLSQQCSGDHSGPRSMRRSDDGRRRRLQRQRANISIPHARTRDASLDIFAVIVMKGSRIAAARANGPERTRRDGALS